MGDRLSIKEAPKLVGRSTDTIYRWRVDGIDVTDRLALLEYSEIQELRSRGRAARLALDRADAYEPKKMVRAGICSAFPTAPDPEKFYDIPSPIEPNLQGRAINQLETIHALFSDRLKELRIIGHEQSIQMLEEDLSHISEGRPLIEMVLHSFYD